MKTKNKVITIVMFIIGLLCLSACATTKITPAESKITKSQQVSNGETVRNTTIRIGDCNEGK